MKSIIRTSIVIFTIVGSFNAAYGMMTQGSRVVTRQIGSRVNTRPVNSQNSPTRPSYSPTTLEVTQPSQEPAASILSTSKDLNAPISTSYIPDVDQGNASFYWYKLKNAFYNLFRPSTPQITLHVEEPATNTTRIVGVQPQEWAKSKIQKKYFRPSEEPKKGLFGSLFSKAQDAFSSNSLTKEKFNQELDALLNKEGAFKTPDGQEIEGKVFTADDLQKAIKLVSENKGHLNEMTTDVSNTQLSFDPEKGTPFRDLPKDAPVTQFTSMDKSATSVLSGDGEVENIYSMRKNPITVSQGTLYKMYLAEEQFKLGGTLNKARLRLYYHAVDHLWDIYRKLASKRIEQLQQNQTVDNYTEYELKTMEQILKRVVPFLEKAGSTYTLSHFTDNIEFLKLLEKDDLIRALDYAKEGRFSPNEEDKAIKFEFETAYKKRTGNMTYYNFTYHEYTLLRILKNQDPQQYQQLILSKDVHKDLAALEPILRKKMKKGVQAQVSKPVLSLPAPNAPDAPVTE